MGPGIKIDPASVRRRRLGRWPASHFRAGYAPSSAHAKTKPSRSIAICKRRFAQGDQRPVLADFRGARRSRHDHRRCATSSARPAASTSVVKNTLVKIAVKGTKLDADAFKKLLDGPDRASPGPTRTRRPPAKVASRVRQGRAREVQDQGRLLRRPACSTHGVESCSRRMPGKDELRAMLLAHLAGAGPEPRAQLAAPAAELRLSSLDARKRAARGDQVASRAAQQRFWLHTQQDEWRQYDGKHDSGTDGRRAQQADRHRGRRPRRRRSRTSGA